MKAPRMMEYPQEGTVSQRRTKDPWKDGSRIHIVSGVSVLEAKRIVRTLDDTGFDPERAQLVHLPSKEMIDRQREERNKQREIPTPNMRTRAVPPKVTRAPPPPPRDSPTFERTVMLIFMLMVLGLELAMFVRMHL